MRPTLAFLPSALLGPAVWRPVASVLAERGWPVVETGRPADAPSTPSDALETYLAGLPDDRSLVLLPHSNAGAFVPAIVAERSVAAVVFVDAGVPPPAGQVPVAPPAFRGFLRGLADEDGLLPPWTQWWAEEAVAGLFPDSAARRTIEAEQHRLPLGYFDGALTAEAGWDALPAGYLAFGDTYAEDRATAGDHGWPMTTLAGEHLHMLMAPDQVADALEELLKALDLGRAVRDRPR